MAAMTVPAVDRSLSVEKMEQVAFLLKTTAHPTRIVIVRLLATHERLPTTDIGARLNGEQSLRSHHLPGLRLTGILGSSRNGKNSSYARKMREVIDVIQGLAACTFL